VRYGVSNGWQILESKKCSVALGLEL